MNNNCVREAHPDCTHWKLETHYLKYYIQKFYLSLKWFIINQYCKRSLIFKADNKFNYALKKTQFAVMLFAAL